MQQQNSNRLFTGATPATGKCHPALVECPRDAIQGWKKQIPTDKKVAYINTLLQVGFHTIDFGSFVSPRAIPQMADTKAVVQQLDLSETNTKLLAIVANERGAVEATQFESISYLGFPFSISPTFQQRNINSTLRQSLERVAEIQKICNSSGKTLVIYLSMAFGNPYGDVYNEQILLQWANEMVQRNIKIISLADTVGLASPEQISFALNVLQPKYTETTFGVHLHSTPANWEQKFAAAVDAGCRRFDGALKGIGGCPMAGSSLVGNMNTEQMIAYLETHNGYEGLNKTALQKSLQMATELFS